ncbi:Rv3235 family protein [Mycetocola lacteus]|uniref:Rv3235 family protein n=1 Tax=Mycetocola lacteus TaxID=76637 RepID=UPI001603E2AD|nr:Rv3235 family protein [Mycetocola lacteus]
MTTPDSGPVSAPVAAAPAPAPAQAQAQAQAPAQAPAQHPPRTLRPGVEIEIARIALAALEALAGMRDVSQLARWLTPEVYTGLERQATLARRGRSAHGQSERHVAYRLGPPHFCRPTVHTVEATIIAHGPVTSVAVVLRLETHGAHWRASVLHVL